MHSDPIKRAEIPQYILTGLQQIAYQPSDWEPQQSLKVTLIPHATLFGRRAENAMFFTRCKSCRLNDTMVVMPGVHGDRVISLTPYEIAAYPSIHDICAVDHSILSVVMPGGVAADSTLSSSVSAALNKLHRLFSVKLGLGWHTTAALDDDLVAQPPAFYYVILFLKPCMHCDTTGMLKGTPFGLCTKCSGSGLLGGDNTLSMLRDIAAWWGGVYARNL